MPSDGPVSDAAPQRWPGRDGAVLIAFAAIALGWALWRGEPRLVRPALQLVAVDALYLGWTRWMRR